VGPTGHPEHPTIPPASVLIDGPSPAPS
jgi:hypothetical protein